MFEKVKKIFAKPPTGNTFFEIIGGVPGITELVSHFYFAMEHDKRVLECLLIHKLQDGKVPLETKQKLIDFLTGWMGGPNVFVEKHGPPKMRARHLHLPIPPQLAEQWLLCMNIAFDKHHLRFTKEQRQNLMNSFKALAIRIINSN